MLAANAADVPFCKNEEAQRLGTDRGFSNELIEKCRSDLMNYLSYKCAYVRIPVDMSRENVCVFDFAEMKSRNLYNNLRGCREAFVLAVTCGSAVDRYLARLRITSQAEYFITDALASTAADSFCGRACDIMRGGLSCKPRFSPGYGDLSLSVQPALLERLSARDTLGITLGDSLLMSPMKSITAIMGIKDEKYN